MAFFVQALSRHIVWPIKKTRQKTPAETLKMHEQDPSVSSEKKEEYYVSIST